MKILLAEDQPLPREAIQKTLESAGFTVTATEDGKKALETLSQLNPDLVLSDIRMPAMTGLQLLQAIQTKKKVPVILMTAFADSCDAPEAYKLGAAGFLAKPFRRDELLRMINGILGILPKEGAKAEGSSPFSPEDFTKVPVEDFVCGSEILCDIYIRLSDDKFIKIAHQGEDLDRDRIEAYKKKGVAFLFMKKTDYAKYLGFTIHVSKVAVESAAISKEKKMNLVKHTGEILSQQLHLEVIDKELYANTKSFLEMSISLLPRMTPSSIFLIPCMDTQSTSIRIAWL